MMCYKSKEQHPPFYILDEIFKFFSQRENHSKPEPERTIMKNEIEGLITNTIAKIKTALDNNKPGEAKVYTEILVLLRQTINVPQESRIDKLFAEFHRNNSANINKPFEKISEKHILDAPLTDTK